MYTITQPSVHNRQLHNFQVHNHKVNTHLHQVHRTQPSGIYYTFRCPIEIQYTGAGWRNTVHWGPQWGEEYSTGGGIQYREGGGGKGLWSIGAENIFFRVLRVFRHCISVRIFLRRNSLGGASRHLVRPKLWSILG